MRIPEDGVTPRSQAKNQEILMEIGGQIRDYVKDKPCKVYPAPLDARFPETDEADDAITTVVQPDILVGYDEKHEVKEDWMVEPLDTFVMVCSLQDDSKKGRVRGIEYYSQTQDRER